MSVIVNSPETAPALTAAALVDAAAPERVLVLGSFPPPGRDLDLLARKAGRDAIADALAGEGFAPRGPGLAPARPWVEQWVRFSDATPYAVDLHSPERYGLDDAEVSRLFDDAVPLEGMGSLARCAPHHVLLLTARGLVRRGRLGAKRQQRVELAIAEDPACWSRARALAPAWGLGHALEVLERTLASVAGTVFARSWSYCAPLQRAGARSEPRG